jgi:hypothetical protein
MIFASSQNKGEIDMLSHDKEIKKIAYQFEVLSEYLYETPFSDETAAKIEAINELFVELTERLKRLQALHR